MARKRFSDEDALRLLREKDGHLHDGLDVVSAYRKVGISDKTYFYWRKKFGCDEDLAQSVVTKVQQDIVAWWVPPES